MTARATAIAVDSSAVRRGAASTAIGAATGLGSASRARADSRCDCCQLDRPILVATAAVELCAPCAVDELERQQQEAG